MVTFHKLAVNHKWSEIPVPINSFVDIEASEV